MIADLKPYPAMKDSGVEWLGDVPEHWEVVPNRALFDEIKDRDYPDEQMLSVTIKKGVIRQVALLEDSSKKDSSNLNRSNYKLVQPSDIAYNKMRAWQGAVGVSDYRGIISPAYVVQRPRAGCDSRYFHYLLRTPAFAKEAERWSYGITSDMWSLRPEHFKMICACLPPHPEQAAIVRFTDHVDRRVRRYVRAKQKLIGLLEEQKQVIINHAVTRGLDPNVRLKPSGIEWLGEIPEHWSIKRLRFLVKDKLTYGANEAADHANSEWPRYLRITDFRLDGSLREDTFCSLPPQIAKDYLVQPGDILFARSGATVGKTFLVGSDIGEACHAGYLIRARPNRTQIEPAFLFAFTQSASFSRWKDANFSIATIQNISANKYADLHVPVPSINEQRAILAQLDTSLGPHQTLVGKILEEIKLIKGYYARLIADVVMGKLDVRAAAAALPDEPDEPETVDVVDALAEDEGDIDIAALPEEIES